MQQKAKNGSKKTHFFDFTTNYIEGTDCNMDDLAEKLRVVSFEGGFPLQIERDEFENEMNDEFMRELITQTHCGNNKLFIIDKMKEKYKNVSKAAIKHKFEDISTNAIVVDPDIYEKQENSSLQEYMDDLRQLFTQRDNCSDEESGGNEEPDQPRVGNTGSNDKDKKGREREKLTEEKVWHLGKALNGSKEGITRPKNKILAEFLNKNPSLPKRQVDRKAKDISSSLYLVHPDLFEEFGLDAGLFLETIKNQFKDREANAGNINNELDANNKDQVDKLPLVYNTEENDLAEAPDRSGEQIERATNPKNESPQKEKKNEESPVKNSKADMDQDNSKLSPKNKSLPTDQEETRNSGSGPGRPRGAKSKPPKPQQVQGSTLERFFLIKGTSDQNNHSTLESTSTIRNEKENDKLAANFEQAAVQSNPEEQN